MISFIVIGRNEENNLRRCFESLLVTIRKNKIKKYEVIFIDSRSEDNSITIAKQFKQIKIFKIVDKFYNSAVARNIGAKESVGDVLFFIEGDTEIESSFLRYVLNDDFTLKYDYLGGVHIEAQLNEKGKVISEKKYGRGDINKDQYFPEASGMFLIKRNLWQEVDGMKNKFKRSQDIDFALRLAKKTGVLFLRKKEIMNKQYRVPHQNIKNSWNMLLKGYHCYSKGMLYREHFFNALIYPRFIRNDYTILVLLLSLILVIFHNINWILLYLIVLFVRAIKQKRDIVTTIDRVAYYFTRDLITILSFLFLYPKNRKTDSIKYIRIYQ